MQRLSDDLISYMRTVEIAGVDVVQARRHGLAQKRDRTGNIARRAPHKLVAILSGELHRALTHPTHSQQSTRERKLRPTLFSSLIRFVPPRITCRLRACQFLQENS